MPQPVAVSAPLLKTGERTMAYAIFKSGGKQYRVTEGELVDVEKIDAEVGDTVKLEEVLLSNDGSNTTIGAPFISGAAVTAEVVDQFRDKKVLAFKFKRRKGYHKTIGHRRQLTRLKISSL